MSGIEEFGIDPALQNIGLGIDGVEDFPGYNISSNQFNDNPFNGLRWGSNSKITQNIFEIFSPAAEINEFS